MNRFVELLRAGDGRLWVLVGVVAFLVWWWAYTRSTMKSVGSRSPVDGEREQSTLWATANDVRSMWAPRRPDPRRMVIGEMDGHQLVSEPHRSILVLAPTGAGKTPRVVVPTVLRHEGPAVIASVKSDVLALTGEHRRSKGPVWVFDPSQSMGETARWSPLTTIRTWADALSAAGWIQAAAKTSGRGLEGQQFWDDEAEKLLAPLMFLVAQRPEGLMSHVHSILAHIDAQQAAVTDALRTLDPLAGDHWALFCGLEARTRTSVVATASNVFKAWSHPLVANAVNVHAGDAGVFNIDKLFDSGGTLYLVAPPSTQAEFKPVYETLVNAVLREVEDRYAATARPLSPPLLVMLDEAANIAPLRDLDRVASSMAGMGVNVVTVWQDAAQIEKIYGRDGARVIQANHGTRLHLAGISDPGTLEDLSRAVGRDVVQRSNGTGQSWHEIEVAPPHWVRQLGPGEAIAISGNMPPMRVRLTGWFEDKHMRAQIPARVAAGFDADYQPAKRHQRPLRVAS